MNQRRSIITSVCKNQVIQASEKVCLKVKYCIHPQSSLIPPSTPLKTKLHVLLLQISVFESKLDKGGLQLLVIIGGVGYERGITGHDCSKDG